MDYGTVAGTAPQVRWVHRLTSSLPPPPQEPQEIGQPRMRPASRSLPGPPPGRCAERTLGHGPNRSPVGQSPPDHSYSAPSPNQAQPESLAQHPTLPTDLPVLSASRPPFPLFLLALPWRPSIHLGNRSFIYFLYRYSNTTSITTPLIVPYSE